MAEIKIYEGPAAILQDLKLFPVRCTFTVHRDDNSGLLSWSGSYHTLEAQQWPDAGAARLKMPDMREGAIIITFAHSSPAQGQFTGSGEPPVTLNS